MKAMIAKTDIRRKRLYIATFGCQMNEYDSIKMIQVLGSEYSITKDPRNADLILVNTCSIREKAEHKLYSLVGRFKEFKLKNPELIIGVGGCVAQQEGERLLKSLPHIDLVFGPQGLYRLPEMIGAVKAGAGPVCATELSGDFAIPFTGVPVLGEGAVRAFVTIMQGCDNFCTYCIVPYVRGREVSRPVGDIFTEAKALVEQGVKEIILLGQNVNSYGKKNGGLGFAGLLKQVAKIPGLLRLRFTTSHPRDLGDDVAECFRDIPNLCKHLHLPVQSGSTRILKRMNRRYTREDYLDRIKTLRDMCPSITFTTDIIAGFPGETDEDFEETMSLLKEVGYEQIFAFKYSPRPFTKAAEFEDQVPEDVKAGRLKAILELQNEISLGRHEQLCGREVEVLVEGQSKTDQAWLAGRTTGNHVVNFPGPMSLIGQLVNVRITKALCHCLCGELV
ncbi:MAG: tRNA (N6-isopentenyl adenosine(37)-C2)-methylthiotransferase MiaB [Dissulfurimicrobium hydrothermale]|uniref:tRNA (N6-isopentenyl adenosine(37)-C2)-methylthiotransferase MiaB n=1 Tax=Dissulfurimicrobium hydrothermale TaxID=1750598 RepID=UPI003C762B38